MRSRIALPAIAAGLVILAGTASASLIVVDTLPANNQANLSADAAQTFTTGTLGFNNLLFTIEVEGPQTGATATLFTLELWTDTDGDFTTWDPGVLVATSVNSAPLANNTVVTYNFSNEVLSDTTVYGFTYTDGASTRLGSRPGLTSANEISNGAVFSGGSEVFADSFDTAFRVTTVPEPTSAMLLGLTGLALLLRRRAV